MHQSIIDALLKRGDLAHSQLAVVFKDKYGWQSWSRKNYLDYISKLTAALNKLGVRKGDCVAILSSTRMEWAACDLAILGLGAVTVPIYESSKAEEIEYILNDAECKVLIVENREQMRKWRAAKSLCPTVSFVVQMNLEKHKDDVLSLPQLANEHSPEEGLKILEATRSNLVLSDLATIIYTSGTTGKPKGVLLKHLQIISELEDLFSVLGITPRDRTLSFLPYAHIMGRIEHLGSVYIGYTLAFAESIERIKQNLVTVKPTVIIGVPRIYEKIYNGIITLVEANPVKHRLFQWASIVGRQVSRRKQNKTTIPAHLAAQYLLADRLVFKSVRDKLGGNLRFAISGGAPLGREIAEFFHATGLLILEGYGLTETTAAITFNSPFAYKFGTVGRPLGEAKIKIAEDGEILVKSDKVMHAYHRNNEATETAFIGEYFATGDIGEFSEDGFLKITDRKKDLIKTAGGKYVAPQKLENLLKLNKFISNVLIHGDQRKFIVALLTLNQEPVLEYAKTHELSYQDFPSLTQHPKVREQIKKVVAEVNSKLSSYETIKNFAVLHRDFTIEEGELTPSLKVKRKICDEKFKDVLGKMYGTDKGVL